MDDMARFVVGLAACIALAVAGAPAHAARPATPEEVTAFQALTATQACLDNPQVSTVNPLWATSTASCEPGEPRYAFYDVAGSWETSFVAPNEPLAGCEDSQFGPLVAADFGICTLDMTRYCKDFSQRRAHVTFLENDLGCKRKNLRRMIARAVNDDGYFQDKRYWCRWGQGGTTAHWIDGQRYTPGFCLRKSDEVTVEFLARELPRKKS